MARGKLRGARKSPIQLIHGLYRTKKTPISPPTTLPDNLPQTATQFHPQRVGRKAGDELIRQVALKQGADWRSCPERTSGPGARTDPFLPSDDFGPVAGTGKIVVLP